MLDSKQLLENVTELEDFGSYVHRTVRRALPNITAAAQEEKYVEEVAEYNDSPGIDELADCYIVACNTTNPVRAVFFSQVCHELDKLGKEVPALIMAAKAKLAIIKGRKWREISPGVYHHV